MLIIHGKSTCLNKREENLGKLGRRSSHSLHLAPPSLNPLLMASPLLLNIKEEKEREGIDAKDLKQSMEENWN